MCPHISKAVIAVLNHGVIISPDTYEGLLYLECEYCDAPAIEVEGLGGDFGFSPIKDEESDDA